MSTLEQPLDSILEPTALEPAAEFDPVSEIKTLRQNLMQRLQSLAKSQVTEKVETNFQFQYDLEAVSSESIETVAEPAAVEPIVTDEPDSPASDSPAFDSPTLMLAQQISHARELLSQLQMDEPVSKRSAKKEKTRKTDSHREEFEVALPSLDTLQKMNTALTGIGFFALVMGVFLSFRYMGSDLHFALPFIIAGITVIALGCLGRLIFLQPQL